VAHTYSPSYSGGGDGEDHGWRSAQAKSLQDPNFSQSKLGMVAHSCHPSYDGGMVQGQLWAKKSETLAEK
jgi:hypothetical protein